MSEIIVLTYDCTADDCDGVATSGATLFTDADASTGEPIRLDIDHLISQITLTCDDCGSVYYTGDADDFILTDADL